MLLIWFSHAFLWDACPWVVFAMLESGFGRCECAHAQDGYTVLHSAAYGGSKEIVEFLLQNGADVGGTRKVRVMNLPQ